MIGYADACPSLGTNSGKDGELEGVNAGVDVRERVARIVTVEVKLTVSLRVFCSDVVDVQVAATERENVLR